MKITTGQLRQIIREEIARLKREGYEHISKNMGRVEDQTEPSEYTNDGADIYNRRRGKKTVVKASK